MASKKTKQTPPAPSAAPDEAQRARQQAAAQAAEAAREAADLPSAQEDAGAAQVQAEVDAEQEQGFRGVAPDPTPNEHYTVQGVASGKPTPETDPELAAKVQRRVPLDHLRR
jgi:hypothetical protein